MSHPSVVDINTRRKRLSVKITYLHQHFKLPTESGGSRPYEFAQRLAQDGHEVTVIAGGEIGSTSTVDGFRLVRIPAPYQNAMTMNSRLRAFMKYVLGASSVAVRTPCDVVFASSTPLTIAIPALAAHWVRRKPMVFEVRDLWPELPIQLGFLRNPVLIWLARALERRAYLSSEIVVALSPWMKEGVQTVAPQVETIMIPNACDFSRFDYSGENREIERQRLGWSDKFVLVYAGSFGQSYGLEWLVELAALLDDRFEVVMFGEGASSNPLKAMAAALNLDPDRMFPGMVSKAEVARIYNCADAVVSCLSDEPALEHNSLNKVFDGLAAGRPVLTNHGGWLTDLLAKHGAGSELSRSPQEAKEQLEKGILSWDTTSMGRNAVKLGREYFDRDELYRQLVDALSRARE